MAETDNKQRIDVMVSSTFVDMKGCREAVVQAMHSLDLNDRVMEGHPAPDNDPIGASLHLVDGADIYIGLLGGRYGDCPVCPERNPEGLSLTELEYNRAVVRDIPRVMFEVGDEFPIPNRITRMIVAEGPEVQRKREAFRQRVARDRALQPFDNLMELQLMARDSLSRVKDKLEAANRKAREKPAPVRIRPEEGPNDLRALNAPYVMQRDLIGRTRELRRISEWAREPSGGILLFRAIGGMGKSALTWKWAREDAVAARDDWAGRLWYSFYLQGATLRDFLVLALCHINDTEAETFKERSTYALGLTLRAELDRKPWLIVMDGLERVLIAYNRQGKESMSDEEADLARDGLGLERKARNCVRPEDDTILAMLAQVGKGKILMSSRLLPEALTSDGAHTIPGTEDYPLTGLAREDGGQLLVNAGVTTSDLTRMQNYLQRTFACHPLSILVIPGVMRKHRPLPFGRLDFDTWVDSSLGGRAPGLLSDSLRVRQNHILAVAFDALDADEKAFLANLSMMSSDLTLDIVALLNPKRPPQPPSVGRPWRRTAGQLSKLIDEPEFHDAYHIWLTSSDPDEKKRCEVIFERYIERDFASQEKAYAEAEGWGGIAEEADQWIGPALERLSDYGLIAYDPYVGALDIHPAVRHTSLGRSGEETGKRVSDALASKAKFFSKELNDISELSLAMDRVRALCAGKQLDAAFSILRFGGLVGALYRLGAFPECLELLQVWFPEGWSRDVIGEEKHADFLLNRAAMCLDLIGQAEASLSLTERTLRIYLSNGDWRNVSVDLANLAVDYEHAGRWFEAERYLSLSGKLAKAIGYEERWAFNYLFLAVHHIEGGRLDRAQKMLGRALPPRDGWISAEHYKAHLARAQFQLARRRGESNDALVALTLQTIRYTKQPVYEVYVREDMGRWLHENGAFAQAVAMFDNAIALARRMGMARVTNIDAARARALLAVGQQNDAARVASAAAAGANPDHAVLAELWLDLGDTDRARSHAVKGFTQAWGCGPPYYHHWNLERCRKVLTAVSEPEPVLAPFDAARYPASALFQEAEILITKSVSGVARLADRVRMVPPPSGDQPSVEEENDT